MNQLSDSEYYPRMALGKPPPTISAARTGGQQQLRLMKDTLLELFRVVEPSHGNSQTYGHQIRSLLILAATEFEAQCKGILKANNASPVGRQFTTQDYVKLRDPLKLSSHSVALAAYPQYHLVKPFDDWDASSPTQSLLWYDAYNQTKHDREANFSVATFERTIEAVAACEIILFAQWSGRLMVHAPGTHDGHPFVVGPDGFPAWPDSELYPGRPRDFVTAINYPF